jgi:hypothetical protein
MFRPLKDHHKAKVVAYNTNDISTHTHTHTHTEEHKQKKT